MTHATVAWTVGAIALGLALPTSAETLAADTPPPNVLLIIPDDSTSRPSRTRCPEASPRR